MALILRISRQTRSLHLQLHLLVNTGTDWRRCIMINPPYCLESRHILRRARKSDGVSVISDTNSSSQRARPYRVHFISRTFLLAWVRQTVLSHIRPHNTWLSKAYMWVGRWVDLCRYFSFPASHVVLWNKKGGGGATDDTRVSQIVKACFNPLYNLEGPPGSISTRAVLWFHNYFSVVNYISYMRITDNRGMEDAFHHTRDIYYSVPTPDILRSRNLGPGESDFLLPGL